MICLVQSVSSSHPASSANLTEAKKGKFSCWSLFYTQKFIYMNKLLKYSFRIER